MRELDPRLVVAEREALDPHAGAVGRHVGGEVDRGLHVASQRSEVAVVDADQQRLQPESAVQLAAATWGVDPVAFPGMEQPDR